MSYKIKDHSGKSTAAEPVPALSSKEQFLFFVEEHRGLVWGGILLIVVLIGGLVTFNWMTQQEQEEAWALQGKAQHMYLDRPLDDIEKGKANVQEASGMFQTILEKFPGTPSAKVSSFLLGNSLLEAENYQGAIEAYTSFIERHPQDHVWRGLVHQRLGLAHLLSGNRAEALNAFDAVLSNPHALNKDQVLFELAKLSESEENTEEAVTRYKQVIQEFPLSPFSTEANLRVKALAPEESQESQETETPTRDAGEDDTPEPLEEGEGDTHTEAEEKE